MKQIRIIHSQAVPTMKDEPIPSRGNPKVMPLSYVQMNAILGDTQEHLVYMQGSNREILIAAPHHAPLGTTRLPCQAHPEADENAGLLACETARQLDCACLVACNSTLDPNKNASSEYSRYIYFLEPSNLVEIHGHGGKKAKFDIEISCGSRNRSFFSEEMAARLGQSLSHDQRLRTYTLSGKFDSIYFQATRSVTILEKHWLAFHIELPKSIRASSEEFHPFCTCLAETIRSLHENPGQRLVLDD